jgi:hypothetical protein
LEELLVGQGLIGVPDQHLKERPLLATQTHGLASFADESGGEIYFQISNVDRRSCFHIESLPIVIHGYSKA